MQFKNRLAFLKTIPVNFTLLFILIVATFLRFYQLGFQDAWLDEIHTLKESDPNLSFKEFDYFIMFREGISHFYFLIVRFYFEIFGQSIAIARSISAIFGVFSVFYIYKVATKLHSNNAGYIAAILLTINLTHIEYSQEARVYAVYLFFVILSVYHLLIFKDRRNYKNAIILGISTGLIANSHSIGVINIAVVIATLFILLITTKSKSDRILFLKQCLAFGFTTILVFSPVYLTIKKASEINSFWVAAPSFINIKQVFVALSGNSLITFYISLVLLLVFGFFGFFYSFKSQKQSNKLSFNLFFLLFWIVFCSSVLIIKSYSGTSLILTRYFISILPAIVLTSASAISYFRNKWLQCLFVGIISLYSLYFIFNVNNYYTKINKTQFSSVTKEIINKKTTATVYSSWGWLMSYYINKNKSQQEVVEMNFDDYITAVRNNAVKTESFWYMDGNYKPFNLSLENQGFLSQNFNTIYSIEKFDTWAKYYEPKKTSKPNNLEEINLFNTDFTPNSLDGSGNLMLFESGKTTSSSIKITKGNYNLIINANSLPMNKLNNENAHIQIKINQQSITNFYLSENTDKKENIIPFTIDKDKEITVSIIFDNDLAVDGFDRNVIIYNVKIKKK
jgi:uncharacterized membrane protein